MLDISGGAHDNHPICTPVFDESTPTTTLN
jgi:hypothetical protein